MVSGEGSEVGRIRIDPSGADPFPAVGDDSGAVELQRRGRKASCNPGIVPVRESWRSSGLRCRRHEQDAGEARAGAGQRRQLRPGSSGSNVAGDGGTLGQLDLVSGGDRSGELVS